MNIRTLLAELTEMVEKDPSLLDKELFIREAYGPRLYSAQFGGEITCYAAIDEDGDEIDTHYEDAEDAECDGYELSATAVTVVTIETPL